MATVIQTNETLQNKKLPPFVKLHEIALKFAKHGAKVLNIRKNQESYTDNFVELEQCCKMNRSLQ